MKRFHDYRGLAPGDRGAAVAMGNFDGVHLGHQSVLALAHAAAAELGAPFGVVTFEPHPRSFFAPDAPPFRLMTADARARRLEKLGVEVLYELPFDAALAGARARRPSRATCWRRGSGCGTWWSAPTSASARAGPATRPTLKALGARLGFGVTVAPLVSDAQGDFSSTAIRAALADGPAGGGGAHPRPLAPHRGRGPARRQARPAASGFPTANLWLDGLHLPRFGVYAVLVDVLTGPHRGRYDGAASIGVRPTFGGEPAEPRGATCFDFDGDLYGAELSVALVAFQRPELKFDDVEALVAQMQADVAEARDPARAAAPG